MIIYHKLRVILHYHVIMIYQLCAILQLFDINCSRFYNYLSQIVYDFMIIYHTLRVILQLFNINFVRLYDYLP